VAAKSLYRLTVATKLSASTREIVLESARREQHTGAGADCAATANPNILPAGI
jgi:hypothetical protein